MRGFIALYLLTPQIIQKTKVVLTDTLPADISGAKVYKASRFYLKIGIGSTVEIAARPFAFDGFKAVASVKGMYEDISEETTRMSGQLPILWMVN